MEKLSLQILCLNRIASDIQFWCSDADNENFNGYLYVLGPFDHLGSRQIQGLLNILAKKKVLKVSYLQSLLHGGITTLDLSACNNLVSDTVVKMISVRCQKLCYLAMPNCRRISVSLLQQLITSLPNLRSLDLSGITTCKDIILQTIAKHCKHLHVLKLESCKEITDKGVAFLNEIAKIVELNLSGTRVSDECVLMLLQNHQHLQSLSLATCSSRNQNFFGKSFLCLQETKLRYLDLSNTNVDDNAIANTVKVCPSIHTLNLSGCFITDEILEHLVKLEHLEQLELDASPINCAVQLPTFLRTRGAYLVKLHLLMSSGLDTGLLAQYCPHLVELSLSDSTNVLGSPVQKIGNTTSTLLETCQNLKVLNLHNCGFSDVKDVSEHFSSIFCKAASKLEILNLSHIKGITDESLISFVESSCFEKLRIIDISSSELITVEVVQKVVECCRNLEYLNARDCWKVHRCDIEKVKEFARKLGRAVELDWK